MKQPATTLLIFFAILFAYTKLAGPIPFSVTSVTTQKTDAFTVTGEGRASVVADIAIVQAGVTSQAGSVKRVQNELNTKTNAVADAVKKQGVSDKDIATSQYSIYPTYDYQAGGIRITGYTGNANLTIKVRDLEKANAVIDSVTGAGANQIGGISFEVENRTKALDEARQKAVENARAKAQAAAKTAGFTLGRVVGYQENESGVGGPVPLMAKTEDSRGGALGEPTHLEPGSTQIILQVSLSFEIR